jgi:hypothetical protein
VEAFYHMFGSWLGCYGDTGICLALVDCMPKSRNSELDWYCTDRQRKSLVYYIRIMMEAL